MEGKGANLWLQRHPAGTSAKFSRSRWGGRAAEMRKGQNKSRHLRQDLNACKNADTVPLTMTAVHERPPLNIPLLTSRQGEEGGRKEISDEKAEGALISTDEDEQVDLQPPCSPSSSGQPPPLCSTDIRG